MKRYTTTFTVPSGVGYDENYRAEITEHDNGVYIEYIVKVYRILPDREFELPTTLRMPSLNSAKKRVRDRLPRHSDTRLKWTEEEVESEPCCK